MAQQVTGVQLGKKRYVGDDVEFEKSAAAVVLLGFISFCGRSE